MIMLICIKTEYVFLLLIENRVQSICCQIDWQSVIINIQYNRMCLLLLLRKVFKLTEAVWGIIRNGELSGVPHGGYKLCSHYTHQLHQTVSWTVAVEDNGESLWEGRLLSVVLSHKPLKARLVGNLWSHSYNLYGWFHLEFGSCLAMSRIASNTCTPQACYKGIIAIFNRWIRPAVLELVRDLFQTEQPRK